jgi:hypothetical protein
METIPGNVMRLVGRIGEHVPESGAMSAIGLPYAGPEFYHRYGGCHYLRGGYPHSGLRLYPADLRGSTS